MTKTKLNKQLKSLAFGLANRQVKMGKRMEQELGEPEHDVWDRLEREKRRSRKLSQEKFNSEHTISCDKDEGWNV